MIILIYHVILSQWLSTTVSLQTYPFTVCITWDSVKFVKNKISVITDLKYFLQFLGGFLGQLHINVLFFMTDRINFVWNKWIYTNCSLNELWLFQNYLSFGSRLINLRYDKNSGKYEGLNWSQTVALILQDTCMNTLVIFTRHFFFKTLVNIVKPCLPGYAKMWPVNSDGYFTGCAAILFPSRQVRIS